MMILFYPQGPIAQKGVVTLVSNIVVVVAVVVVNSFFLLLSKNVSYTCCCIAVGYCFLFTPHLPCNFFWLNIFLLRIFSLNPVVVANFFFSTISFKKIENVFHGLKENRKKRVTKS